MHPNLKAILNHEMLSGKNTSTTDLAQFKVIVQEGKMMGRNTWRHV